MKNIWPNLKLLHEYLREYLHEEGEAGITENEIGRRVPVRNIEIVFGHGKNVFPLARAIYNIDAGRCGFHLVPICKLVDLDRINFGLANHYVQKHA